MGEVGSKGPGPMQLWAGEIRQGRKAATVAKTPVCRRSPGPPFLKGEA